MEDEVIIENGNIPKCKNCLKELVEIEIGSMEAYCEYCESYVFVLWETKPNVSNKDKR